MNSIQYFWDRTIAQKPLLDLYNAHNWTAYTKKPERLQKALENSSFILSAWKEEQLIGLARGLTDEISIFYLQDILVLPQYEGQGVGRNLISLCLEKYKEVRQKVLLTDNEERVLRFYQQAGFKRIGASKNTEDLNAFVRFD